MQARAGRPPLYESLFPSRSCNPLGPRRDPMPANSSKTALRLQFLSTSPRVKALARPQPQIGAAGAPDPLVRPSLTSLAIKSKIALLPAPAAGGRTGPQSLEQRRTRCSLITPRTLTRHMGTRGDGNRKLPFPASPGPACSWTKPVHRRPPLPMLIPRGASSAPAPVTFANWNRDHPRCGQQVPSNSNRITFEAHRPWYTGPVRRRTCCGRNLFSSNNILSTTAQFFVPHMLRIGERETLLPPIFPRRPS